MTDLVYGGSVGTLNSGAMPLNYTLEIYYGDYIELFVVVTDDETDDPINLDGYTATARIRTGVNDPSPIELDCTITDELGQVRLYLSSTDAAEIDPAGDYIWDFKITNSNGDVRTYIKGDVLDFDAAADVFNGSGVSQNVTFRLYVNGTMLYQSSALAIAAAGSRFRQSLHARLIVATLTNMRGMATFLGSGNIGGVNNMTGLAAASSGNIGTQTSTVTDLSAGCTISLTAQLSAASTSLDCRCLFATVERHR